MYDTNLKGRLWCIVEDLYAGNQETVQWMREDSEPYQVLRGVKQGDLLSTTGNKFYLNDLLVSLKWDTLGLFIGSIYVGMATLFHRYIIDSFGSIHYKN